MSKLKCPVCGEIFKMKNIALVHDKDDEVLALFLKCENENCNRDTAFAVVGQTDLKPIDFTTEKITA